MNKVGIAIFSFNEGEILERAIESVLNQDFDDIHIYIFDDASQCETTNKILNKYKYYHDKITVNVRSKNLGIVRNKDDALRSIPNPYISYLDGDDFYYKRKISDELKVLQDNNADMAFSAYHIIDESSDIKTWKINKDEINDHEHWLERLFFNNLPFNLEYRYELFKKNLYESVNYYDTSLEAYEDWDCRLRYHKSCKYSYNSEVSSAYCYSNTSISRNKKHRLLIYQNKLNVIKKNYKLLNHHSIKSQNKIDKIIYNTELELIKHKSFIHKSHKLSQLFDNIFKKKIENGLNSES